MTPTGQNIAVVAPAAGPIPSVFLGVPETDPLQLRSVGATIFVGTGPVFGSGTTLSVPFDLVFIKPSGAKLVAPNPPEDQFTLDVSPLDGPDPLGPITTGTPYVGLPPVSFVVGQFDAGSYVVYTFETGDLDELGLWSVYVSKSRYPISGVGHFRVERI